jgi:hypothetical protein
MADSGVELTSPDLLRELQKSQARLTEVTSRYLKLEKAARAICNFSWETSVPELYHSLRMEALDELRKCLGLEKGKPARESRP